MSRAVKEALIGIADHLQRVEQRLTSDFAIWALTQKQFNRTKRSQSEFVERLLDIFIDQDPEASLSSSAQYPMPQFRMSLVKGNVTPAQKWADLESKAHFWPSPMQKSARHLKVGSGRLPTWKAITRLYAAVGFEAVPIMGYVGAPVYLYLINQGKYPVCTRWVMRFKRGPYYYLRPDVLHEIGHALSMSMTDYRSRLLEYAFVALKTRQYRLPAELQESFFRLFEYPYGYSDDAKVELIGPTSTVFEIFKVRSNRLVPLVEKKSRLMQLRPMLQPYDDRAHWDNEAKKFIAMIAKRGR